MPRMLASGEPGHVVNTASTAGILAFPSIASYDVAKQGVVALSEALLADAGLPQSRAIAEEDLATLTQDDLNRPFSVQETQGIATFLAKAQRESEQLFADLAALAWRGQR